MAEAIAQLCATLDATAQQEVYDFVMFLVAKQGEKKKSVQASVSARINAFLTENPTAFDEFVPVQETGLESIRELTKNDAW